MDFVVSSKFGDDGEIKLSTKEEGIPDGFRVSTEVTVGRGDLTVCPLRGLMGAQELYISKWRSVPQASPQGQILRALLLRGTSVLH